MIKLYISVLALAGIYFWAIIEGRALADFINYPALAVVLVPAFLFAISGSEDSKTRVKKFADGAVPVSYTHLTLPTTPYV